MSALSDRPQRTGEHTPGGDEGWNTGDSLQDDLFQYDIAAGLDILRGRLLDLSNRNRLLNFRPDAPRHWRRQLGIVDVSMETVFKRLCRDEEYGFQPVPYPVPGDGVMIPFDEFTNNPETYLDGQERRGAPVGAGEKRRPRAEEYARQLSINTSYELQSGVIPGLQVEMEQAANNLQVLHYADELDQILSSILDTNRTAARELGVTTLFLVFGLLEWGDPSDGHGREVGRLAPLLLMPVVLRRSRSEGREAPYLPYLIEWSGEEIEVNQTLRIMLRQRFGLEIPPYQFEESLESYVANIQSLIAPHPLWRIHHRLTLTNFSFHKLRMWEDLDPGNWPENRLLEHPLVRDFFVGKAADSFTGAAPADEQGELPPLVLAADSSQHAAISQALAGENLVIEGPPGTGKSQTITNLIAAALHEGKSVLFVAEKATALEIVQRRLAEVGLGDFCLCLGTRSDGGGGAADWLISRTRDLAFNLRQRLARKGSYELPVTLTQKREIQKSYRRRLTEYEQAINQPYGACGRTIYETIGRRERLLQSLEMAIGSAAGLARLEALRIERAEALTIAQIESLEENAAIYEKSLACLTRDRSITSHPWYGLMRDTVDPDEEQTILEALQALIGVARKIEETLADFGQGNDLPLAGYEMSIRRLIELEPLLPEVDPAVRRELVPLAADHAVREDLRRLGGLLEGYQTASGVVTRHFRDLTALETEDLDRLRAACRRAGEAGMAGLTIAEIGQQSAWITSLADYIEGAAPLFDRVVGHLECELDYDLASVKVLMRALILLNEAPRKALPSRVAGLEREGIGPVLTRARQEAEQLRRQANSLSNRVDRHLAPPVEDLARYAAIAATAGPFRLISRDYREARREWLGMVKQDDIRTPRQMVRDFRDLLNYQNSLHDFTTRPEYLQVLGPIFNGLQTPFSDYDQLVKWYDRIKLILGQASEPARRVATALFTVPVANLKTLLHLKEVEAREEIEAVISFFGRLEGYVAGLSPGLRPEVGDNLLSFAARLRESAEVSQSICATFADLQVETASPVGALVESLDAQQRLKELQKQIEAYAGLGEILGWGGLEPLETGLDFTGVEETIRFVERLESTPLPREYREWLCSAAIDRRIASMRETTARLEALFTQYGLARQRFNAVTGIDERLWYGQDPQLVELGIAQVRQRAELARQAWDDLPLWLIARRAHRMMVGQGLTGLATLIEDGTIPPNRLVEAVQFIYHNSILHGACRHFPALVEYNGFVLDEIRERFAQIDQEVIELTRREIAARLDDLHVPPGNRLGPIRSYTELGLISHLAANQNARIGIRQAIRSSAGALLALKPCFIMSPLAVSRYLPPESIRFDLVIMDEASQLRPEDALGAVARGGQLVVVGDRLQLPPPSFFEPTISAPEDEATDSAATALLVDQPAGRGELENMLEIASSRYQPVCQLKWHYRSRHQSLINFANREFYQDRLTVFPSPETNPDRSGLKLCYIEDGVWEQNCNRPEAAAVVAAAIDHLTNHPTESLGIVALNLRQRELIVELLERALCDNRVAAEHYQNMQEGGEELFVKNLEIVQGDERDVIFVSGTVGRDILGRFRLTSLGPLTNNRYGHRRLNVLITRARSRLVYFTSIRAAEIQPGPNSSWGVRALKSYLAYLESGELPRPDFAERPPLPEFEQAVATALRRRGLDVISPLSPQPGHASLGTTVGLIDLAIVDPRDENHLLLGIECDGGLARGPRSVRDQNRLRPEVLGRLGWKTHRIWVTDWFRSREREIQRIVDMVARLVEYSPPA